MEQQDRKKSSPHHKPFNRRKKFERRPRQMHDAICTQCGAACKVPFKPTEGREVLCKDCFVQNRQRY